MNYGRQLLHCILHLFSIDATVTKNQSSSLRLASITNRQRPGGDAGLGGALPDHRVVNPGREQTD